MDNTWSVAKKFGDDQGVQGALLFRRMMIGVVDLGNAGIAVEGLPGIIDLRGVGNSTITGVQYVSLSPGSGAYFFRTQASETGRTCSQKYVVVGISPSAVDVWRVGCETPFSFLKSSDGHNLIMSAMSGGGEQHYVMSPDIMGLVGPMATAELTPEDQALIYGGPKTSKTAASKQTAPSTKKLSRIQAPAAAPTPVRSSGSSSGPTSIKLD